MDISSNPELKNQIIKLYTSGVKMKDIIENLNLTINPESLYFYLKKLNIKPNRRITKQELCNLNIIEIYNFYCGTGTLKETAEKYDIDKRLLSKLFKKNGLKIGERQKKNVEFFISNKNEIISLYLKGYSAYKIGDILNINPSDIYYYLEKWKIKIKNNKTLKLESFLEKNGEEIIRLYFKENKSMQEIAELFKIQACTISSFFRKIGLKARDRYCDYNVRTSIEKTFSKLLHSLSIIFEEQKKIENRYFDFFIPKFNLLIELHGDYWHANPLLYKDKKLNEIQQKNIKIDKIKQEIALKYNYSLLTFWESDINNNIKSIENIIKNYEQY